MEEFLPSEVARAVYGYLLAERCEEAAKIFLETSPNLTECKQRVQQGKRVTHANTLLLGRNLSDILNITCNIHSLLRKSYEKQQNNQSEDGNEIWSDLLEELRSFVLLDGVASLNAPQVTPLETPCQRNAQSQVGATAERALRSTGAAEEDNVIPQSSTCLSQQSSTPKERRSSLAESYQCLVEECSDVFGLSPTPEKNHKKNQDNDSSSPSVHKKLNLSEPLVFPELDCENQSAISAITGMSYEQPGPLANPPTVSCVPPPPPPPSLSDNNQVMGTISRVLDPPIIVLNKQNQPMVDTSGHHSFFNAPPVAASTPQFTMFNPQDTACIIYPPLTTDPPRKKKVGRKHVRMEAWRNAPLRKLLPKPPRKDPPDIIHIQVLPQDIEENEEEVDDPLNFVEVVSNNQLEEKLPNLCDEDSENDTCKVDNNVNNEKLENEDKTENISKKNTTVIINEKNNPADKCITDEGDISEKTGNVKENTEGLKNIESSKNKENTPKPQVLKKNISRSTPRRNSHVRALSFTTPNKPIEIRKFNTSPKTPRIRFSPRSSKLNSIKKSSLFKSPPNNTDQKELSCVAEEDETSVREEELQCYVNLQELSLSEVPIATISPGKQLSSAWKEVNDVTITPKPQWDEKIRSFISGEFVDPAPPPKRNTNKKCKSNPPISKKEVKANKTKNNAKETKSKKDSPPRRSSRLKKNNNSVTSPDVDAVKESNSSKEQKTPEKPISDLSLKPTETKKKTTKLKKNTAKNVKKCLPVVKPTSNEELTSSTNEKTSENIQSSTNHEKKSKSSSLNENEENQSKLEVEQEETSVEELLNATSNITNDDPSLNSNNRLSQSSNEVIDSSPMTESSVPEVVLKECTSSNSGMDDIVNENKRTQENNATFVLPSMTLIMTPLKELEMITPQALTTPLMKAIRQETSVLEEDLLLTPSLPPTPLVCSTKESTITPCRPVIVENSIAREITPDVNTVEIEMSPDVREDEISSEKSGNSISVDGIYGVQDNRLSSVDNINVTNKIDLITISPVPSYSRDEDVPEVIEHHSIKVHVQSKDNLNSSISVNKIADPEGREQTPKKVDVDKKSKNELTNTNLDNKNLSEDNNKNKTQSHISNTNYHSGSLPDKERTTDNSSICDSDNEVDKDKENKIQSTKNYHVESTSDLPCNSFIIEKTAEKVFLHNSSDKESESKENKTKSDNYCHIQSKKLEIKSPVSAKTVNKVLNSSCNNNKEVSELKKSETLSDMNLFSKINNDSKSKQVKEDKNTSKVSNYSSDSSAELIVNFDKSDSSNSSILQSYGSLDIDNSSSSSSEETQKNITDTVTPKPCPKVRVRVVEGTVPATKNPNKKSAKSYVESSTNEGGQSSTSYCKTANDEPKKDLSTLACLILENERKKLNSQSNKIVGKRRKKSLKSAGARNKKDTCDLLGESASGKSSKKNRKKKKVCETDDRGSVNRSHPSSKFKKNDTDIKSKATQPVTPENLRQQLQLDLLRRERQFIFGNSLSSTTDSTDSETEVFEKKKIPSKINKTVTIELKSKSIEQINLDESSSLEVTVPNETKGKQVQVRFRTNSESSVNIKEDEQAFVMLSGTAKFNKEVVGTDQIITSCEHNPSDIKSKNTNKSDSKVEISLKDNLLLDDNLKSVSSAVTANTQGHIDTLSSNDKINASSINADSFADVSSSMDANNSFDKLEARCINNSSEIEIDAPRPQTPFKVSSSEQEAESNNESAYLEKSCEEPENHVIVFSTTTPSSRSNNTLSSSPFNPDYKLGYEIDDNKVSTLCFSKSIVHLTLPSRCANVSINQSKTAPQEKFISKAHIGKKRIALTPVGDDKYEQKLKIDYDVIDGKVISKRDNRRLSADMDILECSCSTIYEGEVSSSGELGLRKERLTIGDKLDQTRNSFSSFKGSIDSSKNTSDGLEFKSKANSSNKQEFINQKKYSEKNILNVKEPNEQIVNQSAIRERENIHKEIKSRSSKDSTLSNKLEESEFRQPSKSVSRLPIKETSPSGTDNRRSFYHHDGVRLDYKKRPYSPLRKNRYYNRDYHRHSDNRRREIDSRGYSERRYHSSLPDSYSNNRRHNSPKYYKKKIPPRVHFDEKRLNKSHKDREVFVEKLGVNYNDLDKMDKSENNISTNIDDMSLVLNYEAGDPRVTNVVVYSDVDKNESSCDASSLMDFAIMGKKKDTRPSEQVTQSLSDKNNVSLKPQATKRKTSTNEEQDFEVSKKLRLGEVDIKEAKSVLKHKMTDMLNALHPDTSNQDS